MTEHGERFPVQASPCSEWRLPTRWLGRRTLRFERLESTNTLAAQLADDPANGGTVILADEQTAGRGQYGRRWLCPAGSGVLMSVLLPCAEAGGRAAQTALRRPAVLTAWAAVGVCATIHELTGLDARIKWPNDVLIEGRKVCGILIEQGRGTVAGIGLNVNQPEEAFHAAGLPEAASLAVFTGRERDAREVARHLIHQLDADYDRLVRGDLAPLETDWGRRLGLLGQAVRVEQAEGEQRGILQAVGWNGVVLRLANGGEVCLPPESVRHLRGQE